MSTPKIHVYVVYKEMYMEQNDGISLQKYVQQNARQIQAKKHNYHKK